MVFCAPPGVLYWFSLLNTTCEHKHLTFLTDFQPQMQMLPMFLKPFLMVLPLQSAGVCISAWFMYVRNYFHNLVGKNYPKLLQSLRDHRFHRKQCSNTPLQASPMRSHEPVVSQHLLDLSWWSREAVLPLTAAAHICEHSAPVHCGQCCTSSWNTGLAGSYTPLAVRHVWGILPLLHKPHPQD